MNCPAKKLIAPKIFSLGAKCPYFTIILFAPGHHTRHYLFYKEKKKVVYCNRLPVAFSFERNKSAKWNVEKINQ
jgi:hypothetical protein